MCDSLAMLIGLIQEIDGINSKARLASKTEFIVAEEDYGLNNQRGYLRFVPISAIKDSFTTEHDDHFRDATKMVTQSDELLFLYEKCGVLRIVAQGGKIFTVCDECWNNEN